MKTSELLNILNTLRAGLGQKALKSWKQSRAKLEERIEATKTELKETRADVDTTETAHDRMIARIDAEAAEAKEAKRKKSRAGSISSVVKPMILMGMTNDQIAEDLARDQPELLGTLDEATGEYAQTKKWYISWYRSDMKRKGEL